MHQGCWRSCATYVLPRSPRCRAKNDQKTPIVVTLHPHTHAHTHSVYTFVRVCARAKLDESHPSEFGRSRTTWDKPAWWVARAEESTTSMASDTARAAWMISASCPLSAPLLDSTIGTSAISLWRFTLLPAPAAGTPRWDTSGRSFQSFYFWREIRSW